MASEISSTAMSLDDPIKDIEPLVAVEAALGYVFNSYFLLYLFISTLYPGPHSLGTENRGLLINVMTCINDIPA